MNNTTAVLFIFVKDGQLLFEKRYLPGLGSDHFIFLGGHVEPGELDNLETALIREVQEELGVIPEEFTPLTSHFPYFDHKGRSINPFIITKWQGEIPTKVLDQGNSIHWIPIEEAMNSPLTTIRELTTAIDKHIN